MHSIFASHPQPVGAELAAARRLAFQRALAAVEPLPIRPKSAAAVAAPQSVSGRAVEERPRGSRVLESGAR